MWKQRKNLSYLYLLSCSRLLQHTGCAYSIASLPVSKLSHIHIIASNKHTVHSTLQPTLKKKWSDSAFSCKPLTMNASSTSDSEGKQTLKFPTSIKKENLLAIPIFAATILCKKLISIHSKTLFQNSTYILSLVFFLAGFGVTLERNTTLGKALSAPLGTMCLALIIANLGFAPFTSPIYNIVNRNLVPLAVPLLLFDSDLRRILTDTGTLSIAFLVGAISTIVGTLSVFPFIPLTSLGNNEGWKIASALAARHIGGAVNFVAVAETLDVSGSSITAAIAADNVVVALYFAFLFSISKAGMEEEQDKLLPSSNADQEDLESPVDAEDLSSPEAKTSNISLSSISTSLTVSSMLVFLGGILTKVFLPPGTSALPLISMLTVTSATLFPKFFRNLRSTGTAIGILFMQMFFAVSGLGGSIALVLQKAPALFLFSAMQIGVHFLTLIGIGKVVCKLPSKELYLASNANVGGPTTAAAMAQAKDWTRLILPALMVGILGYATATPIALSLGPILTRLPTFTLGL